MGISVFSGQGLSELAGRITALVAEADAAEAASVDTETAVEEAAAEADAAESAGGNQG